MFKRFLSLMLMVIILLSITSMIIVAQEDITLTMLTHWGEEANLEAQEALIAEYEASHSGVTIELQTVPFGELLTKITTGRTAGTSPDIYHFYHLWLPDFVNGGLLAAPPNSASEYIAANTSPGTVEAISTGGQIWGYPTEVNTYLLLYNERLFEEAGYSEVPTTWEEVVEIASAITQIDDTGAVTQVGYAVITGWDSGVTHPFSALLYSNGGNYLSDDLTVAEFNSPQGVETLQLYVDLIESGGMDMSVSGWDFPNGTVGMIIMANWWRATLMNAEGIDYETEVGVAPVPVGPSGSESSSLSYNWLWGVDANSPNAEAAWDFIHWLNSPRAEGESSPMGDFLVNQLGAIPSFTFDQEFYAEDLSDHFLAPFVAATAYARPEPVVAGGQEVKTLLQAEIEGVLVGLSDPQTALDTAANQGNAILEEQRMMNSD